MTQVQGGRKLEKRLTKKKLEKAQKLNEFTREYLALCERTGHMLFATLKQADPDGTQFSIQYKIRTHQKEKTIVPQSVELQDKLIELEQTNKIEKSSEEHNAKVKEIEDAKAKELEATLAALPEFYADEEEAEIRLETTLKIQDILILSKDKDEALKGIIKYINTLQGRPEKPEPKPEVATEEAKPTTETVEETKE